MPKMVGAWIWVAPREVSDDVTITVGGTVLMSQNDVDDVGEGAIPLSIQIKDEDTVFDDLVQKNDDQLGGPFNLGPNSFQSEVLVPRSKVVASETGSEKAAELYARVKTTRTKFARSQTENVRYRD